MNLGELAPRNLRRQLREQGVLLPCGPFVVRIRTCSEGIADGLHRLYRDFPLIPEGDFVDFEVEVRAPGLLRSVVRPQVGFYCEGRAPFKPLPRHQAFPMLEWGLNWVISTHAHDHLVLHAAVLERGGRALLLSADPGSGKSTLCAGLVHSGWRLLSDELALVELATGRVRPVARPISLKNESIEVVRALGGDVELGTVCPDTTKGAVAHMRPPVDSVVRRHEPALPAWLVFPRFVRGGQLDLQSVGKAQAFMEMVRHAFNYGFLGGSAFDALAGLLDRTTIMRASYGDLGQIVPAIDRLTAADGR
ncbi:HprK-related kinase A [Thauera sp.]|uniref:HprK-related kinase A n=1 Tax=Thauera sp. TaxID=1905334 RepID=UPI002C8E765D|nr:HprK-related kinase A [Thauera sp.]HRO37921.1 HprK-related kinase A [Thauera sp.]